MRATVEFKVTGASHNELIEQSLSLYRQYMKNSEIKLPPSFHMDVKPLIEAGDGSTLSWEAEVTIPLNNSTA